MMENLNIPEILQAGVIGLGFLLALLAFRLLVEEQKREVVRPALLNATYVFMLFSLALLFLGLISEFNGGGTHLPKSSTGDVIPQAIVSNDSRFSIEKGNSQFFALSNGDRKSLSVGDIWDQHSYLYVGFEGNRIQLYIGQKLDINENGIACDITLIGIDKTKQAGEFYSTC